MSYIIRSSLRNSFLLKHIFAQDRLLRPCVPLIREQLFAVRFQNYFKIATKKVIPAATFEDKLEKLTEDERKRKRISLGNLKTLLEDIKLQNSLSSSHALKLIMWCGKLLVFETKAQRIALLEEIWKCIKDLETKVDVSHYNALLKVYLENECDFCVEDILADMEKNGCQPNRITYQRMLRKYCLNGEMSEATSLLQSMRDSNIPISINIFNALILGHMNVNDIASVENILTTLRDAKLPPDGETYAFLASGYVKQGDFKKVFSLLKEAELTGINLSYSEYFYIIEAYAKYGYEKEIDDILKLIKKTTQYNIDAHNFCFSLLAQNKPEAAFRVLKTIPKRNLPDGTLLPLGDRFVSQMVQCDIPEDKIIKYCLALMDENLNPHALLIAMEASLKMGREKTTLALFKTAKRKNIKIRPHYFWPLLVKHGKQNNCSGIIDILNVMNQEFGLVPNTELIREYVTPVFLRNGQSVEQMLFSMKNCGVSVAACVSSIVITFLKQNNLKEAVDLAENYSSSYMYYNIYQPLTNSFLHTKDVDSYVRMLKEIACGFDWLKNSIKSKRNEESYESMPSDHREVTGRLLDYLMKNIEDSNSEVGELMTNIFQTMIDYRVGISEKSANNLKKLLHNKISSKTIDLLNTLSSKAYLTIPPKSKGSRISLANLDEKTLESLKTTMKINNEDVSSVQNYLFTLYTRNNNEEKVLELLQEMKEKKHVITVDMYMKLLNMYIELGKLDKTLDVYEILHEKIPQFEFDSVKLLKIVHLLVYHNQAERAMEIMKMHITKDIEWEDNQTPSYVKNTLCRKVLEMFADQGDVEKVGKFCDFFITNNLGEVNNIVLGPTIKVHIVNDDLESAMNEFEKCVQKYHITPYGNNLAHKLIKKEDVTNLQRWNDLNAQVHGTGNALHNLMLNFIECGNIQQAKKILQLPDFNLNAERILNACHQYYVNGSGDNIRTLLELTENISFPERTFMYNSLLDVYDKSGEVEKALSLWDKIQADDKVQPTDKFLVTLAKLLQRKDRPVPFTVPVIDESNTSLKHNYGKVRVPAISMKIRSLISRGKLKEALEFKNKCQPEQLNKSDWALLLEACVQGNLYEEAKTVFDECIQISGELPLYKTAKFFISAAMRKKDILFLEKLGTKITEDERKRLSYDNHLCRAYLNANRADEYLWSQEERLKVADSEDELKNFLLHFPRGGIISIALEKPEHAARVEQLISTLLERSKDIKMANTLWIYYMLMKDYDKAKNIWTSWLRDTKVRLSIQRLISHITQKHDVDLGVKLLDFIEDGPFVFTRAKGLIFGHVINVLIQENRIDDALELLKRADERIGLDNVMRKAVITLQAACKAKNINFPFEIPAGPEEFDSEQADEHISDESIL